MSRLPVPPYNPYHSAYAAGILSLTLQSVLRSGIGMSRQDTLKKRSSVIPFCALRSAFGILLCLCVFSSPLLLPDHPEPYSDFSIKNSPQPTTALPAKTFKPRTAGKSLLPCIIKPSSLTIISKRTTWNFTRKNPVLSFRVFHPYTLFSSSTFS